MTAWARQAHAGLPQQLSLANRPGTGHSGGRDGPVNPTRPADAAGAGAETGAEVWTFPFAARAVRAARTTVGGVMSRLGADSSLVDDARLVISELLGNALRHARPLPDGTIQVGVRVEADTVRLFVTDGGSPTLPTLLNPPPLALGGRGLSIVRTLTRDWGVHETHAGNTVFGVLALT